MDATSGTSSASSRSAVRRRIVVLDDELSIQNLLRVILEGEGFDVFTTDDGAEALKTIAAHGADLVIQDLRMPKMDGLAFLRQLKERHPALPSIVMTAFGTLESTIEAMRLGAYTHLNKPFDTEEMRQTVARALERIELNKKAPRSTTPYLDMISKTASMSAVSNLIKRVAPTDSTVLITGESGTGKELAARAIHFLSLRADQPFIAVNCGAFTESLLESELFGHTRGSFTNAIADRKGVFEMADRGTLFLDEVGEMTLSTQVKLLRVLETRTFRPVGSGRDMLVDVRFITATNRNLNQMVMDGQFREDLFYRLNVIPIELPPLRERREDIPLLAGYFLAQFAKRMNKDVRSIEDAAIERMLAYHWPGNVRELENTIERAVALSQSDRLTQADLPVNLLNPAPRPSSIRAPQPTPLYPLPGTSAQGLPGVPVQHHAPPSYTSQGMFRADQPTPAYTPPPFAAVNSVALPATPGAQNAPVIPGLPEAKLPPEGMDLERYLMELEKSLITQALERSNGSLTEAAKMLNMTFRSMRYKVTKLGVERPDRSGTNE